MKLHGQFLHIPDIWSLDRYYGIQVMLLVFSKRNKTIHPVTRSPMPGNMWTYDSFQKEANVTGGL